MRDGAKCYMNSETYAKCGDMSNVNVTIYDEGYQDFVEYVYIGWYEPVFEFKYYIPTDYAVFKNKNGTYGMKIVND